MNYRLKTGLNIPVITVLDETGRVIEEEQRRIIRHIVQNGHGADVIFGVGTTGEWNRLANNERRRVMEIEVDEVRQINEELAARNPQARVEAWIGVNGRTRAEILANLDTAIQLGADAAVIAPLAIEDLNEAEIIGFFQRDLTNLLEWSNRQLPVFLYDNADIAAPGRAAHIRTHLVKHLSRLPWVRGIKVSAPHRVIGNYTKAALHYKQPGEFGIYIGNAMLIFEIYRPTQGLIGRLSEGWRDYLLHATPPIGVVSGPANLMPREWQKAWRVCWAGDVEMIDRYLKLCSWFEKICEFEEGGRRVNKTIACLKYGLKLDGVISSHLVGPGTGSLTDDQQQTFGENYRTLRQFAQGEIDSLWRTIVDQSSLKSREIREIR
ncbi:MAG TPA: dihydrodipicolinate synthase family protein [Blastocatellia bacterium]|nr:dihydrodipicolinate synthase family protein [Blastocatellia bacterium]